MQENNKIKKSDEWPVDCTKATVQSYVIYITRSCPMNYILTINLNHHPTLQCCAQHSSNMPPTQHLSLCLLFFFLIFFPLSSYQKRNKGMHFEWYFWCYMIYIIICIKICIFYYFSLLAMSNPTIWGFAMSTCQCRVVSVSMLFSIYIYI